MKNFQASDELKIGHVTEVTGTSIRVELDNQILELSRVVDGRVCAVGQLGSIIKVHYGRKILLGHVRLLRMRSELAAELGQRSVVPGDDSRILEADLFAEAEWDSGNDRLSFGRGIETYPLPLQGVYLTTPIELEQIYQAAENSTRKSASAMVEIGEYVGANGASCHADIDRLLGQHCAILGSTGSGKSGTVASIIRSILEHKPTPELRLLPRVILVDPHGEYASAFTEESVVLRAYAATGDEVPHGKVTPLRLPYWLMSGDELRGLIVGKTEAEATSQNNVIYKALKHARMVAAEIVEPLPEEPKGDHKSVLRGGKNQNDEAAFDRDRPIQFSLDEFVKHIDQVQGRKPDKTEKASASDRKSIDSILDKLSVLRSDPRLSYLMQDTADLALPDAVEQLVGRDINNSTLKIIDVSGVPNEVAGTLTALVCRVLFNYKLWQTRAERERDPVLLVCEEAHRYVPDRGEAQYREAQDAVRRIAKEGRKYGIGLMLVSQRPSDVESTVLSQCNTWIVLRLTNGKDQEHVARFLPDSLTGLTKILPSLSRREAIFVGEAAALPARIRIKQLILEHLPNSHDISFADGWLKEPLDNAAIKAVLQRWTGDDDEI